MVFKQIWDTAPGTRKTQMNNTNHEYWLRFVREHPERFFQVLGNGRRHNDSIYQMLQYFVDISISEFQLGHGDRVELTLDFNSGRMSIRDYGRGFPISNLAHCFEFGHWGMTDSHISPTIPDRLSKSVVNGLSSHFRVRSVRNGKYSEVVFAQGKLVFNEMGTNGPDEKSGSFVELVPDATIFPKYTIVDKQVVRRIRNCATANPGLTFILNGREVGRFFNWAFLSARHWAELLAAQPQFADRCDKWNEMDGRCWAWLLGKQPQFADKCDWSKLSSTDWMELLHEKIAFADRCDWSKLNGWNWCCLLLDFPQLADKCDWKKAKRRGVGRLLAALLGKDAPQRKGRISCSTYDLAEVLSSLPQFADILNCWNHLSASDWELILMRQPQFAERCGKWAEFSTQNWYVLLQNQPQFANRYDKWEAFDCRQWAWMMARQPQLASRCDKWGEFDGSDWSMLLSRQPQFADRCDWGKLQKRDWSVLLSWQPQFYEKRAPAMLDRHEWASVISWRPDLAGKCDWGKFNADDWVIILMAQPQFAVSPSSPAPSLTGHE